MHLLYVYTLGGLSSFLIMPVQRVPRYVLLLTELLRLQESDGEVDREKELVLFFFSLPFFFPLLSSPPLLLLPGNFAR